MLFGRQHSLKMCAMILALVGKWQSTLCLTQLKGRTTVPGINSSTDGLELAPVPINGMGTITFQLGSNHFSMERIPARSKASQRHEQHQRGQRELESEGQNHACILAIPSRHRVG